MDIYPVSHTVTDRTPYTYCLTHLPSGKRYYGVKWSEGCHPSTFWTEYKTSSDIVKELIAVDGEDTFTFEIRKIFKSPEDAKKWEKTVLRRLNVPHNDRWFNRHVPGDGFCVVGPRSEETKRKISAGNKGKPSPRKGKTLSKETRRNMSNAQGKRVFSPETRAKMSESRKKMLSLRESSTG